MRMVNGGQRNLGMAVGAGLLWLADSMLQVTILLGCLSKLLTQVDKKT